LGDLLGWSMIGAPQHHKLMKEYQRSGRIGRSAAKAGVDRKTAAKYLKGAPGPAEERPARTWRTREDAFSELWATVERRLEREPMLLAKTLWEELSREHPGRFRAGQRRTFERRVREWKQAHGGEPTVVFRQDHLPGERLQIDWVDCRRLGVRIGGADFAHKLVHAVLPCSNWEWARVCGSESFLSLKTGLQGAVWELGGVPSVCQTDNSSTATHQLDRSSRKREYNARYLSLLAYYGMRPALTAIGKPQQNGDVESAHHHLVRAIEQRLMLRGSREFPSVEAYEEFVEALLRERNAGREEQVRREREHLAPLPAERLPEYEEEEVRVNREAIVRVGKQAYSVPSRWAGAGLRARVTETAIRFYKGPVQVAEVERHRGDSGVYVNWRHVIGQLARKPGAFARWRHREAMFPSLIWRRFYDNLLRRQSSGRAEREYLGVLQLAAGEGLERLEEILDRLGDGADLDHVRRELDLANRIVVVDFRPDLSGYDEIIRSCAGITEVEEKEGAQGGEEAGHVG